jgi:hypothetical protein
MGTTISVYGVYSAVVKADASAAYTGGTNKLLTSVASVSNATTVNTFDGWYNGKREETINAEGDTTITVSGKDLSGEYVAMMLGKVYDDTNGIVLDDGSQESAPYMTCSYAEVKTDSARLWQYLKGKWSIGSFEAGTKTGGGFDPKQVTLTFNAVETEHEFAVTDYKSYDVATDAWVALTGTKTVKNIFKDVDKDDYDVQSALWFSAVQAPDALTVAGE